MSPVSANPTTLTGVASTILYLINFVIVPVIFAIAFLVFLYGAAKSYIFSQGEEAGVKEGHQLMLWGLIGFVVMISIWGLVNVVSNTFGLSGYAAPGLPTVPVSNTGGSTNTNAEYNLTNMIN